MSNGHKSVKYLMSGPFYGSLAASASVFVAILTALLVNNYVRIKSDRRQTQKELNRVKEELQGLQTRRDNHQETVDKLIEKRESDYREEAEELVDEFIEHGGLWDLRKPIEKLTVDELYQELIDSQDCDSTEEFEEEPFKPRHRNILEERIDEIYDKILDDIIPSFAKEYEGEGWDPNPDGEFTSLVEAMEEQEEGDDEKNGEDEAGDDETDEPDRTFEVEPRETDVLELEEFIEKYKEEHRLDTLHDKTKQALKEQYRKVVDKNPNPDRYFSPSYGLGSKLEQDYSNPLDPLNQRPTGLQGIQRAAEEMDTITDPMQGIDFPSPEPVLGLTVQEKQKLEEAQEDLREVKSETRMLQHREDRLERELEGLNPEDLNSTLWANVATISLSVVVPVAAYLDTVTEFTVPQLSFINIWWITGSWLLGLIIVFVSIYCKINNNDGKEGEDSIDSDTSQTEAST